MTETFKVGQKVKHDVRGEVEVTYGPYTGLFGDTRYLVRQDNGREVVVTPDVLSEIPTTPAFAVGDVVALTTRAGAKATVEYGPFDDRDVYVVKLVDEPADPDDVRTFTALASVMRKAEAERPIEVGDRVRVTDDDGGGAHRFNGRVGTVVEVCAPDNYFAFKVEFGDGRGRHGDLNGRWNCVAVERVTDEDVYEYDGVPYDLSAKYRDRDGDVWEFARFGDKVVGLIGSKPRDEYDGDSFSVAAGYGPLTRVTA
ncbi:phiSA1p31-related protein [Streptomyces sp. bgisy159]|uniref:phiSA1p31-related protein n=1 Tax=Streptomyces sp. bgisy159 TaxID=3413795 RepID=UPI003F49D9EA